MFTSRPGFTAYGVLNCALALTLVACGGGGSSDPAKPSVDPNYLAKYQGSWAVQCATPIEFSPGIFGPASKREKLTFSAPDATGMIKLVVTEDYFDSTLACYDMTTPPYASVVTVLPIEATFDRVEQLYNGAGLVDFDVLKATQPSSAISVTGTNITSVTVGGIDVFRITFSDGKTVDQNKTEPADTGEIGLWLATVNGVPNAQLTVYGASDVYRKIGL